MANETNQTPGIPAPTITPENVAEAPSFYDQGIRDFAERFGLAGGAAQPQLSREENAAPSPAPAPAPAIPQQQTQAPAPAQPDPFTSSFQQAQQEIERKRQIDASAKAYRDAERARILAEIPVADPNDPEAVGFAPKMREQMAEILLTRHLDSMQNAARTSQQLIAAAAPQIEQLVAQRVQEALNGNKAQDGFFGAYPALNNPQYQPALVEAARVARQFAPANESSEVFFGRVANLASQLLGVDVGAPAMARSNPAPQFVPARANGGGGNSPNWGQTKPPRSDIGDMFDLLRGN